MLKTIAVFSKTIAKYAYYPMFIGIIAICSAFVYRGTPFSGVGIALAAVCAILTILGSFYKKLCRRAGIDDTIR